MPMSQNWLFITNEYWIFFMCLKTVDWSPKNGPWKWMMFIYGPNGGTVSANLGQLIWPLAIWDQNKGHRCYRADVHGSVPWFGPAQGTSRFGAAGVSWLEANSKVRPLEVDGHHPGLSDGDPRGQGRGGVRGTGPFGWWWARWRRWQLRSRPSSSRWLRRRTRTSCWGTGYKSLRRAKQQQGHHNMDKLEA